MPVLGVWWEEKSTDVKVQVRGKILRGAEQVDGQFISLPIFLNTQYLHKPDW